MPKNTTLFRGFETRAQDINQEERTLVFSFSSEEPVERWFGYEILVHSEDAVDLKRLNSGAPLLIDHQNSINSQIGVVERAWIENGKGYVKVRFSKNNPVADRVFADIQDNIIRNVSVGYMINEAVLDGQRDNLDVYKITRWTPFEVSFVSVPADQTVGVGRDFDIKQFIKDEKSNSDKNLNFKEDRKMSEEVKTQEGTQVRFQEKTPEIDIETIRKQELERVKEIMEIGKKFKVESLAEEFVRNGKSVDEFRTAVLEKLEKAGTVRKVDTNPEVGLSEKEARQFSFLRVIQAQLLGKPEIAAFEREVSEATAKKLGRAPQGLFIPMDVLKRDLTKGVAADGGYTVSTDLLASNFIELLRNKAMVRRLGATVLSGLVGDIAIPKQTGGATAYWISEGSAPTESQQAFGQVAMTPKTVGAFTDVSRKLLLQSSIDVEAFVRNDLATVLALAIDAAAINGSGTAPQPLGILNATGVGLVGLGTNGGQMTWDAVVKLETLVADKNADIGSLRYLTNAKVRGALKTTPKVSGYPVYIWENGGEDYGMVNGYRAYASNQVPSNLTKGTGTNLSAMIFGNWSDLVIGEWGALDLLVDPYTQGTAGTVRIRVLQDVDIALRHPESFAVCKDIVA